MYSLMFPLSLYLMEVKLCKRLLISALSLWQSVFQSQQALFGIGNLFKYHTPKGIWNAALYDHKTHAIQALPLLIKFLLFRRTRVYKRRELLYP